MIKDFVMILLGILSTIGLTSLAAIILLCLIGEIEGGEKNIR